MKSFLYLFLLTLAACGEKQNSTDYGKMTTSELIAKKGAPLKQEKTPLKNVLIFEFENNEKYQIKGDVVTNGFKNPEGDQKTLLFWKHKFKDCQTTDMRISKVQGDTFPESELKCSEMGLSVIYTEGSGIISRVVEHEKK